MSRSIFTTSILGAVFCLAPWSHAANVAYDSDVRGDHSTPYVVSNSDLLQTSLAPGGISSTGDFTYGGPAGGVPVLNDGAFLNSGNNFPQTALANDGSSITYTLSNPLGYAITGINTYSGWDAYLGGQNFTVAYDTVVAPGVFTDIASPRIDLDNVAGDGSSRVMITDSSGVLATGVHSLRFSFGAINAGPAGFRELDVFGSAVPEPSSIALGSLALAGLMLVARRRRAA